MEDWRNVFTSLTSAPAYDKLVQAGQRFTGPPENFIWLDLEFLIDDQK